jgi:hypothetical protein
MAQSEIIFAVQESPEGGYEARALGYSIFTQADSMEELKTMVRDAVSCHFENGEKPNVIRLHTVRDEVIPA